MPPLNRSFFSQKISENLWHSRLGHLSLKLMERLKNMVGGLQFSNKDFEKCRYCVGGKHARAPFPKEASRATEKLAVVHADLGGPFPESLNGSRYYVLFIDDWSRYTSVFFLKRKSDVFEVFQQYKTFVEKQSGKKVLCLRTDRGGEFCSKKFDSFLVEQGIRRELTAPYSPQQDGVCERANRSVIEKARTMLIQSGLGKEFWAESVSTSVFLKNRSPTIAVKGMTPYEAWTGRKVNLKFLRTFGCSAFVHLKGHRSKLDPKSKEHIFVGYSEVSKAYRLIDPDNAKKVVISRDVVFFEDQFPGCNGVSEPNEINDAFLPMIQLSNGSSTHTQVGNSKGDSEGTSDKDIEVPNHQGAARSQNLPVVEIPNHLDKESTSEAVIPSRRQSGSVSDSDSLAEEGGPDEGTSPNEPVPHLGNDSQAYQPTDASLQEDENKDDVGISPFKRKRQVKPYFKYGQDFLTFNVEVDDLPSVDEALKDKKWLASMKEEMDAMYRNKVWSLVKLPEGRKAIKNKWVFKVKRDANNDIVRHKSRLCACGYSQKKYVDYHDTFAPVIKLQTLRLLLALAVEKELECHHLDVTCAFLFGDLQESIYMMQPEGFIEKGKEDLVCKLNRTIYGLKQSAREWHAKMSDVLIKMGYKQCAADPCLYYKIDENSFSIIGLFVDDVFVLDSNIHRLERTKKYLASVFEMKDLGPVNHMLGIRVKREGSKGTIRLDQEAYIDKILDKFQMTNCSPTSIPLDPGLKLEKPDPEEEIDVPYQQLIGSLNYLAVATRPDISNTVSRLAQFNKSHGEQHWNAALNLLRYLKKTKSFSLVYRKTGRLDVVGFCDADYGSCLIDRKSYSGYVFTIGRGGPISWESRKQATVAQSSTESEYLALSEAGKEALFLRHTYSELAGDQGPVTIYNDSQSAQCLTKDSKVNRKTKHIDLRAHAIRDYISKGEVSVKYLDTNQMPADVLTKPLPYTKHKSCIELLSIEEAC